jgi:hypothetical protein
MLRALGRHDLLSTVGAVEDAAIAGLDFAPRGIRARICNTP